MFRNSENKINTCYGNDILRYHTAICLEWNLFKLRMVQQEEYLKTAVGPYTI